MHMNKKLAYLLIGSVALIFVAALFSPSQIGASPTNANRSYDILFDADNSYDIGEASYRVKTLYVYDLNIADDQTVSDDLNVTGDLNVAGNVVTTGTTRLVGAVTAVAALTAADLTATDDLGVGDDANITGDVVTTGTTRLVGAVTAVAALTAADLTATDDLGVGDDANITGDVVTTGTLRQVGAATFVAAATVGTTLGVTGIVTNSAATRADGGVRIGGANGTLYTFAKSGTVSVANAETTGVLALTGILPGDKLVGFAWATGNSNGVSLKTATITTDTLSITCADPGAASTANVLVVRY